MAVGTIRHPDGVRPVELQRQNTQTSASTPPRVAAPFCTTLQRVKKVSFDENALKTDEFRSNHPSKISQTLNPPRLNYFPIKEFDHREVSRIAEAFARQRAQDLFREVYESGDEFDEPNELDASTPPREAALGKLDQLYAKEWNQVPLRSNSTSRVPSIASQGCTDRIDRPQASSERANDPSPDRPAERPPEGGQFPHRGPTNRSKNIPQTPLSKDETNNPNKAVASTPPSVAGSRAKSSRIRVGTDCSGMDVPIMAIQNLGIQYTHEFSCDNDKSSKEFIQQNFPPKVFFDEIKDRDFSMYEPTVKDLDLYVAGFPCQSFSSAGLQRGLQDDRGKIIFHVLDFIQQNRPRMFVLENVRGFTTLKNG